MGALLKKAEMKIMSLQEQLDRKGRDNQELTQLLDDLIAKMGPDKWDHDDPSGHGGASSKIPVWKRRSYPK